MFLFVKWPVCSVQPLGPLTQSILFSCLQLIYRNHINVSRPCHLNPWLGKVPPHPPPVSSHRRRWAAKLSWRSPTNNVWVCLGIYLAHNPSRSSSGQLHTLMWRALSLFYVRCLLPWIGHPEKISVSWNCTFYIVKVKESWQLDPKFD